MPQVHGRNSVLHVWDSSGTSRSLTGDMTNVTLSWSRTNSEMTAFTDDTVQRLSGIRDATLTGAAVWNNDTNQIETVLQGLLTASANTLLRYFPAGCISGSAFYTGCFLLNQYQVQSPVDGVVTATFAFEISSGSLTASTV